MSNYQQNIERVAETVSRFFGRTFDAVEVTVPAGLQERLHGKPVMIACTHRSQADYFVVGYVLFQQGVRKIRYAAGDNLTKLPIIGKMFLSYGAFPVERSRARDRTYLAQLPEQVASMLLSSENVLVFPEGGRSYGGEMMAVNQGVIGGAVMAQARDPQREVLFLPCAVSYEQLPELLYFSLLEKGRGMRKKERPFFTRLLGTLYYFGADAIAFSRFLLAHRFGWKYGKVYVDIGEPFAVGSAVDLAAEQRPSANGDFWSHRASMKILARTLAERFHGLYRLLPMHVVARLLKDRASVPRAEACDRVVAEVDRLREMGRNTRCLDGRDPKSIVDEGIRQLSLRKFIAASSNSITVKNRTVVNYYASAGD